MLPLACPHLRIPKSPHFPIFKWDPRFKPAMLTQALCCRFICNIHRAGRYVRISWGKYSWEDFTNSNNSTANLCQQRKTGGLGNKRNGGCFYGLYDLYCDFNSFYLFIHYFLMHITATDINRMKQVGKERTETEGVYDFYCELNSFHLFIHTFTCLLNFWYKTVTDINSKTVG